MLRPNFTKYAPIPHPERKPSLKTILDHVNTLGWIVSAIGLAAVAILLAAAARRVVSWALALLVTGVFAVVWYRSIFLDAKYETNGERINMGCNDFPNGN